MKTDKAGRARWIVDGDRLIDARQLLDTAVQIQIMPSQIPITPAEHSPIGFLMASGVIVQFDGPAAVYLKTVIRAMLQEEGFTCTAAEVNEAWLPPEAKGPGEALRVEPPPGTGAAK